MNSIKWREHKSHIESSYNNGVYNLTCEILDAFSEYEFTGDVAPKLKSMLPKFELQATLTDTLSLQTLSKEERLSVQRFPEKERLFRKYHKHPIEESSSDFHRMLDILRKAVGDSDPDRKLTIIKVFNMAYDLNEKYQHMKPPS